MNSSRDFEADILKEYEHWKVYIHQNQAYLGRSYVALNRDGEVDPFIGTSESEKAELNLILTGLHRSLDKLYQPDLLNYANLRNTWNHCHWHVIPRYQTPRQVEGQTFTDNNWGKNYAPYDMNFEIPIQTFEAIKQSLSKELKASDYNKE